MSDIHAGFGAIRAAGFTHTVTDAGDEAVNVLASDGICSRPPIPAHFVHTDCEEPAIVVDRVCRLRGIMVHGRESRVPGVRSETEGFACCLVVGSEIVPRDRPIL